MIDRRLINNFDFGTLGFAILITCIGILTIFSVSAGSVWMKQIVWMGVGICGLIVIASIDYHKLANHSYVLFAIMLVLLIMVLFAGTEISGASRWFKLGPVSIQPSELMKIVLIIVLARYLSDIRDRVKTVGGLIFPLFATGLSIGLILIEPDLGTSMVLVPILFVMLWVAGARLLHLGILFAAGCACVPVAFGMLKEYQKRRLLVFLDPDLDPLGAGWHLLQSKIAIGSGQLFGQGWGQGRQTRLGFLPEHHTDFIFSALGEQWGFLGALVFIVLFALLLFRIFMISYYARDMLGSLMAIGVFMLLAEQFFINVGMTIGVMPITGLPLPFMSYGGSSLVLAYLAVGLAINVRMRQFMF